MSDILNDPWWQGFFVGYVVLPAITRMIDTGFAVTRRRNYNPPPVDQVRPAPPPAPPRKVYR